MADERASFPSVLALWCPACGGEVAPNLLSCPSCHRLVHSDRLKGLAETAEAAERAGALSAALSSWQEALTLLPPETRQHAVIAARIARLGRQVEAGTSPRVGAPASKSPAGLGSGPGAGDAAPASRWSGGVASGVVGTLAFLIWKFKFLAVLVLTKAKFLVLGLTKASTFFSMLAAFGVYWTAFGGWFALGFVLSIYVHEMGHVAALMRYGVPASAPLFLPGLGAVIRLNQAFTDRRQDARVGLAGPIWGTGAAMVCLALFAGTQHPLWAALARVGAWINLFNLMPIWQLDGGRAFRSLTRSQRWLAVAALATAWAATSEGLLVLLMVVGAARTAIDPPVDEPDPGALAQYVALVAVLSALVCLPVPGLA